MDIFLAMVLCAITIRMGYVGVDVTLHPIADADNQSRTRVKRQFIWLALFSCFVVGCQAYRSMKASSDLIALIKKNQSPSVGLSAIRLEPPSQKFVAGQSLLIGMAFTVADDAEAKSMRCNFEAFTLPGRQNTNQNRDAIDKFRMDIAANQATGEDRLPGTSCYKGLLVKVDEPDISEIITGDRIIYAMAHSSWKNDSGADFHTDVCKWMESPKTRIVSSPGWHDCVQ